MRCSLTFSLVAVICLLPAWAGDPSIPTSPNSADPFAEQASAGESSGMPGMMSPAWEIRMRDEQAGYCAVTDEGALYTLNLSRSVPVCLCCHLYVCACVPVYTQPVT